jgi:GAF domain-containing protein
MPQRAILEVSRRLLTAGAGQDLYRTLVAHVRRAFGRGASVSFFLVYRSSDLVLPIAESRAGGERIHPEAYTQKISAGILGAVVKSGQTYLARDVSKDPLFVSGGQTEGSEVCVPVLVDGDTVGILNVECRARDAFSAEAVHALELLCAIVGNLMNSGIVQEQVKALEAQVAGARTLAAAAELRFQTLAQHHDGLVVVVDGDGKIVWQNGGMKGTMAKTEGKEFEGLVDAKSAAAWAKAAKAGGAVKLGLAVGKKKVSVAGRATLIGGAGGAGSMLLVLSAGR